jgi:hypothetical protein
VPRTFVHTPAAGTQLTTLGTVNLSHSRRRTQPTTTPLRPQTP